jgi:hypothetical protein
MVNPRVVWALSTVIALSLTSGCTLYSLSSACGPDGSYCISTTGGTGTGSNTTGGTATSGTTGSAPTVPGAPTAVVATAAKSSASVAWGAAAANGSPVSAYFVTIMTDGGSPDAGALDAGPGLTASFPGLTPGSSYSFSVVAQNGVGTGAAGVSNAVVPFSVPAAPMKVRATAASGQAQVTWLVAVDNASPITAYTITASPGGQMVATDGMTTSAMVSGLADYTAYTFDVTATNAVGEGPPGHSNAIGTFPFVTTLAGNGDAGWADGTGGPAGSAMFNFPFGIALDAQGTLYVADSQNEVIRKVAPDGTTSTLAGSVQDAGWADGPGASAMFANPTGVAVDGTGNVFVADPANNRVREVAPDGTTGTVAGNGDAGWLDGVGVNALFFNPTGVAVDTSGNVYVADLINNRVRKILPDGTTSTLAGNGDGGWADGTGAPDYTAVFAYPYGVAVDAQGVVYVADFFNYCIRKVASDGTTTTLAGNRDAGWADGTGGPGGTTQFGIVVGVGVDVDGNVYVADTGNNRIRKVAPDGTTTTLAGNGDAGYADGMGGPNGAAMFTEPTGVVVDSQGVVYVTDYVNQRIRKIIQ